MTYVAASVAIAAFVAGLWLLRIIPAASKAVYLSREAAYAIRSPDLSDIEKERAVQHASVGLMGSFASIAMRGVAALAVSILPIYIFDVVGLAPFEKTIALLETWEMIIGASIVMTAAYLIGEKR